MTSNYDPCGTPETAGGCASCPMRHECEGGPTDSVLADLESLETLEQRLAYLDATETPVTEAVLPYLELPPEAQRGFLLAMRSAK